MKKWIKVEPEDFSINIINDRIVLGDDDFAVWGLGKNKGSGINWADITKRADHYEIAVGKKFLKTPRWKKQFKTRDEALKNLKIKMREMGKI